MAFIRLREVSKCYGRGDSRIWALRNINIELEKGEFVVLLGPESSGKSTLLNILAGLERPTAGSYFVGRQDFSKASDRILHNFRRKRVGLVAQFPKLVPQLTVLENLKLVSTQVAEPMPAEAALALVGLSKIGGFYPAELSASERYLVAIGRALAKRPDIVICNQPTEALVFEVAEKVVKAIEMACAALDITAVVSSRSIQLKRMGSRILHLMDGRILGERRCNVNSSGKRQLQS